MSITLEVGLLSGKTATVKADLDEEVATLKSRAETALGVGRGRLVGSSGSVLDARATVKHARLQDGDSLTLHMNRVQVQASLGAFAAILGDRTVVTWGSAPYGGDSRAVQDQLNNVQQIHASNNAFAAILGDGSVDQLKNVQQIQATGAAFAAILADGTVVAWGDAELGGDSSAVQDQLKKVQQMQASDGAFAAILGDGSVVTWGDADRGGDSSTVQDQLKDVQQIQASAFAFAAILGDGSVVTWGGAGDSTAVREQVRKVQQIHAARTIFASAFAAILGDGSVATWGHAALGGDSSSVQDQLKKVQQIQASDGAFAAILGDGSVVTWGHAELGGDSRAVQDQLKKVQQIQATDNAFAAILRDGSVVTWGHAGFGGDSRAVQDQLKKVQQIQASDNAFAAILGDRSIVTWGHAECGGDSSAVQDQLKNVQQIQASARAFAAILGDGSVVTWGHYDCGGDSSAVQDRTWVQQDLAATQDSGLELSKRRGDDFCLEDCSIGWTDGERFGGVRSLNLRVAPGELLLISGPVGSGKTLLLEGLAGTRPTESGVCQRAGRSRAFVAQRPWLLNGSLLKNVLFGQHEMPEKLQRTLESCALIQDLDALPSGIHTLVGEEGVQLSGGQKQRVSLARAVYSSAEVVLLDDVLSALDAHVGQHVWEKAICGALDGRTRILVTHQIQYWSHSAVSRILMLRKDGSTEFLGTYQELCAEPSLQPRSSPARTGSSTQEALEKGNVDLDS
eukprot:s3358_g2.t3